MFRLFLLLLASVSISLGADYINSATAPQSVTQDATVICGSFISGINLSRYRGCFPVEQLSVDNVWIQENCWSVQVALRSIFR